jgi:hypothetical protein
MLRGRRALVLWLLVAMLHVWAARPAIAPASAAVSSVDAAFALFIVPVAGAILTAGLTLFQAMRRRRTATGSARRHPGRPAHLRPPAIAHVLQRLAPRAPPLAIS